MLGSIPYHYTTRVHDKEWCPMLGLHDKHWHQNSWILASMFHVQKYKNHLPQCIFVYHLPCNAYLFGDAYSQLVGELLYSCIKDMFFMNPRKKVWSRSHWKGMYCICCMADYSTPHLSYQSLATDYDACSTDSWRYHLTAFLIFECTFAKQCLLCETASHLI